MSKLPLVSVCIPAFNSDETIGETLDSIQKQNFSDFEIVVSDNQSTDNTKKIISTYSDRVRYCLHTFGRPEWAVSMPAYIGGFANWNFVLSQGCGDFLCLYHSDDLYEPDIVEKQVALMQAIPEVGAVFTNLKRIDEDGHPIKWGSYKIPKEFKGRQVFEFSELFNETLYHGNFLPAPSVMIRRKVFEEVGGFDERHFLTSADLEMWLRIAQRYPIGIIDEPLLKYRISEKQFGSQYQKLRTTVADFFGVMDHFLSQDNIHKIVQPESKAMYELDRAADEILCAINLLTLNKVSEAQVLLGKALKFEHLLRVYKRPRRLIHLAVGYILCLSILLGFGRFAGESMHKAYHKILMRHRKSTIKGV